jgi:hypothetical protein
MKSLLASRASFWKELNLKEAVPLDLTPLFLQEESSLPVSCGLETLLSIVIEIHFEIIRYVRDLTKAEKQNHLHTLKQNLGLSMEHRYEFLPYNSAYLQKENTEEDVNVRAEQIRDKSNTHDAI